MPILVLVELAAQIYFGVHAIKTGRSYYWMFIIFVFPVVGSLVYFFVEYLPEMQEEARIKKMRSTRSNGAPTGRQIKQLEEQVEITPSLKNMQDLAEAYTMSGCYEKAILIYKSCLDGPNKSSLSLHEGLATAYFHKGDFVKAKEVLLELKELRGERQNVFFDLLIVRSYEELGQVDQALEGYEELYKRFSGEEARCRYALLLKKTGDREKAERLFGEVVKNVRQSPQYYQKAQMGWVNMARKNL